MSTMEEMKKLFPTPPDPSEGEIESRGLSDELLGEYHAIKEKLDAMTKLQKALRAKILDAVKDTKGAVTCGSFTVILKPRKGSASVDWEKWGREMVGDQEVEELLKIKDAVKDGVAESGYIKEGRGSVSVEVTKATELPPV